MTTHSDKRRKWWEEIKRTEFVPNYTGVVAWVRMTEFFKAIEKELEE